MELKIVRIFAACYESGMNLHVNPWLDNADGQSLYIVFKTMAVNKERIRQVMTWANMSQQEFAVRLKVSPASLSSIFSGRTRPTNMHVEAIHDAFPEININWLLFEEGEMLSVEPKEVKPLKPMSDLFDEPLLPMDSSTGTDGSEKQGKADVQKAVSVESPQRHSVAAQRRVEVPQRQVTEIRVFYDNGTYESFFPQKK